MKCPVCKEPNLVMSERQGIEIDYCPQCRGVWLDRGELDKILEKALSAQAVSRADSAPPHREPPAPNPARYYPAEPRYESRPTHYKKPKSWLSEIFD